MNLIYLDYGAGTPIDPGVLEVMRLYFSEKFYNPSAGYQAARSVRGEINEARAGVAMVLGVRPAEIIFTAGGTEANNLALAGTLRNFPGSHVVTTALEHESVLGPVNFLATQGWSSTEVKPQPDGIVDPGAVIKAVHDKTVLVSVMYANNEIGTIQPLRKIAAVLKIIREQRQKAGNTLPLYFHTDACQAANYLDVHAHTLGVDMMTLNGGKIYGPKQSGVLFAASHVQLAPIVHGGGQENGRRSGTENVAGIIGFAEALVRVQNIRTAETHRLQKLQQLFMSSLADMVANGRINGSLKHRLPNNVHITLPGQDNERLIMALDEQGIQAAAGSACGASKDEPSHVLKAIGLTNELARSSLRFTMGQQTNEADIRHTIETLAKLAK